MEKTVVFRDFEERDIDFVYKCKNDEKLNSMIVGQFKPFSYEDAVKWVHGCMGEHETYKFWAIATNDEEKRAIGWLSLSDIDTVNHKACYHGLVIGDKDYQDGFAWIESFLFVAEYVFERLNLNRMYGSAITEHKSSILLGEAMLEKLEGVQRQAVYKNGRYYDVALYALLRDEYFAHKEMGDYELISIIRRIGELRKNRK